MKESNISTVPYYFLHIPKTAGTSLNRWFQESGLFNICPDGLWSHLISRPKADLVNYSLFFGHFYRHFSSYIGTPLNYMTFLRNPIDRSVSHYQHILRDKAHYLHRKTLELGSFEKFLCDPETKLMIENFQTRSLSLVLDHSNFKKIVDSNKTEVYPLERFLESAQSDLSKEASLIVAKDFLLRCKFFGITERMDESISLLSNIFIPMSAVGLSRLNVNPLPSYSDCLTGSEYKELAKLIEIDWELYEFASTRFQQGYQS